LRGGSRGAKFALVEASKGTRNPKNRWSENWFTAGAESPSTGLTGEYRIRVPQTAAFLPGRGPFVKEKRKPNVVSETRTVDMHVGTRNLEGRAAGLQL